MVTASFLADFLHWRTRQTHRSTTLCQACGHTAHVRRPSSPQFLMGHRVGYIKMEEKLLLLENLFFENIIIREWEKRLGEPNFRRNREVWRVSYFVPCCGSSCSVHPTVVYVHTPKKSISQYEPFSSNIKKRKRGIDVLSTKLHDTLAYTAGKNKMIWFQPSVGKTCPCTSVQHGATETVSTYLTFRHRASCI